MSVPINRLTEKRLRGEMRDLHKNKLEFAQAVQDEKDPFIFYFLLKAPSDTVYAGGYYIGKILLPQDYPQNPGDFEMLTPSGRFNIGKKICLTNSGYHRESWNVMWSVRNIIIGFLSIFVADDTTGLNHIVDTPENRKKMAFESISYNLTYHRSIFVMFDQFVNEDGTLKSTDEIKTIVDGEVPKKKEKREKKDKKDKNINVDVNVNINIINSEKVVDPDLLTIKNMTRKTYNNAPFEKLEKKFNK